MRPLSDEQLRWCMDQLGLDPLEFEKVRRALSQGEAEKILSEIKATAKRNYRKASRELHPDLAGNDPEKEEQFRLLTEVMDQVQAIKVQPPVHRTYRVSIRVR